MVATRITADLDTKNKFKIIYSIFKSLSIIEDINLLQLIKSHNNNYHLIVWSGKNYSKKKIFKIREKIGDDTNRIRSDKLKKHGQQTLFYKKYYYRGSKEAIF